MKRSAHPLLLLLPLVVAPATSEAAVTGKAYDAITTPGRWVTLRAKFERTFWGTYWRPDLTHKRVELRFNGRRMASTTDGDGIAGARFRAPSQPGTYTFSGVYRGTRLDGTLWVLDPRRPLAVVDIDGTISDLPSWLIPFRGARAPTYAGAPALLHDLARTHQVVYLTARDDHWDGVTRPFLARHRFPAGPVIYNEQGQRDHAAYKLARLRALQGLGLRPALGIGNAETDGQAYRGAGIPSYLRNDDPGPGFRFLDYADLRARLVRDGFLPAAAPGLSGSLGSTP